MELDCQFFVLRHLAKVRQIGADDRNSIRAGQVRHAAASRRRRVRHRRYGRTLEKTGQGIFLHVAGKLDSRVSSMFLFHLLHIAVGLGMVASGDHQPRMGQGFRDQMKSLDHEFEPFVSSPFAEGEDAVFGITPSRKVGIFRPPRKYPVRTKMYILASIFFVENFPVARHQHRH
jgi:hypothetical protein